MAHRIFQARIHSAQDAESQAKVPPVRSYGLRNGPLLRSPQVCDADHRAALNLGVVLVTVATITVSAVEAFRKQADLSIHERSQLCYFDNKLLL
jgi:hypothetical protein